MSSLKRKTIASLIASYISQFSTSAANFVIKMLLARLILPSGWGVYAEATMVVLVADTFTDVGLSQHVMREKHRPYGNVLLIRLLLSAIAVLLIEAFAGWFDFLSPEVVQPVRALAPIIMVRAIASVPRVFLDREMMVYRTLAPQILGIVTMGAVSLLLAYRGAGVYALVIGAIAQELVFCVMLWAAASKHMPLKLTFQHTTALLRGSRYLFLIAVVGFILQQGDIAITGTILRPAQVGLYAMAFTIISLTSKLVETAIYRVVYPLFCQYAEKLSVLGKVYVTTTLVMVAIEAPIYFYLLFNARFFVLLTLGAKWMPMAHILAVLSIAGTVNPFSTFGFEVLRATKRDRMLTVASVSGAATLLIFGTIFTLKYGAVGMAASNYVIIGGIVTVVALCRIIPDRIKELAGKLAIVYAVSFVVAAAPRYLLGESGNLRYVTSAVSVLFSWALFYLLYVKGYIRETFSLIDGSTNA